ncbi:MAG: fumarate hydratase C-terminal domain-containing protein [Lachnospiraceae bacterium]
MKDINTPITDKDIESLHVGDMIMISGSIYCGRDAVLPKVCRLVESNELEDYGIYLQGSVIFHTAVSVAGVGPTSSNKLEIESSIPALSAAGVKIHLGKGKISRETICALNDNHSVYAVIPPVTALLKSKTISQKTVAFEEEGMEAFHLLEVNCFPAIIAAAHGKSIYDEEGTQM